MRKQRFRKDEAGTLEFYPPEGPTDSSPAPTVEVKDPRNAVLVAAASATVNAISTTLSSAAAEADDTIAVASATGIARGARLWLGGDRELVRVRSVSGTTITLADPLDLGHASGAAVKGQGLTATLTAGNNALLDYDYRALWRYSVDGVAYAVERTYDVVRNVFRLDLSADDMRVRVPEPVRRLSADLLHEELLDQIHQQMENDLVARSLRPDLVRATDQFRLPGILLGRAMLLGRAADIDAAYREAATLAWQEYTETFGRALFKIDWYDQNNDDSVGVGLRWDGTQWVSSGTVQWDGTRWISLDEQGLGGTGEEGFAAGNYLDMA